MAGKGRNEYSGPNRKTDKDRLRPAEGEDRLILKHMQHCVFQSVFSQQPLIASSAAVLFSVGGVSTYSIRHGTAPQF